MSDFSLTTFSKKGTLKQIENAMTAVAQGETAIGIKCKNGVVLAVEKRLPSVLIEEDSLVKI
jgi:20S proteasome subunit alpha 2